MLCAGGGMDIASSVLLPFGSTGTITLFDLSESHFLIRKMLPIITPASKYED